MSIFWRTSDSQHDSRQPKAAKNTGQRLLEGIDEILHIWEGRVRHQLLAAQYQDSPALRDTLPAFLAQLAKALSPGHGDLRACESTGACKEHGGQRSSLPMYRHQDIIMEYRILQQVIFKVLSDEGPIPEGERDIIRDSILLAVSDAVTEYLRIHNDLRQHFMLTLTHDLRTPLTAIKAGASMMLRYPDKEGSHARQAQRIVDSVERADSMIADLLDASRVQMGERLSLNIEECDLHEIVCRVIEDMKTIYGDRFKLQSSGSVKGHWNRDALRRCVENLLSNAVKYGYRDTPVLVGISHNEERLTFNVLNQGEPLKPEQMADLFQPFKQSENAKRSGSKGWGLGLTLVRGVAEALGGKVLIKSGEGEGTAFSVDIPMDSRPFQNEASSI